MKIPSLSLLLSLSLLIACGDDGGTGPGTDAGTMDGGGASTDGGGSTTDGGGASTDGGTGSDAGMAGECGELEPGFGSCDGRDFAICTEEGEYITGTCPAGRLCDSRPAGGLGCYCTDLNDGVCPAGCIGDPDCNTCSPSCAGGNACGDDGCGTSCGVCSAGSFCNGGTCAAGADACGGLCTGEGERCRTNSISGESYCDCPETFLEPLYDIRANFADWGYTSGIVVQVEPVSSYSSFSADGSYGAPGRRFVLDTITPSWSATFESQCAAAVKVTRTYTLLGQFSCQYVDIVTGTEDLQIPNAAPMDDGCTAPAMPGATSSTRTF